MKVRYYILIAVFSYLFFTLANMPAAKVLGLVKSQVKLPVQIQGVEGSLWDGSARSLSMRKQPPLNNLHWSINPLPLLMAQLSADVEAQIKQQKIQGHVNFSLLDGQLSASDIRAELSAAELQQLINLPFGDLQGKINIEIQQLQLVDQQLTEIDATARWDRARFTLAETVSLGNIQIKISSDADKNILADISNKGGQIKITGHAKLQTNKNYQLDIKFIPSKNATINIRQSLAMFAKRQGNGSYRFKQGGNLRQLGL